MKERDQRESDADDDQNAADTVLMMLDLSDTFENYYDACQKVCESGYFRANDRSVAHLFFAENVARRKLLRGFLFQTLFGRADELDVLHLQIAEDAFQEL